MNFILSINIPHIHFKLIAGTRRHRHWVVRCAAGRAVMTTLCVHRVFDTHSVGIWNRNFYQINGVEHSVRQIQSYSELISVFSDELMLPQYPLALTLELLERNGAEKLFEV
jgi:hypothetical protein